MPDQVTQFFGEATYQDNPLKALTKLVEQDDADETAHNYEKMRFVGYVLEIGFEEVTLITSDPFKQAVGGVPRGSFLVMVPESLHGLPPHFTLLRVKDVVPTPLAREVQQTYFELHKRSMPELDIWTRNELQWGALRAAVLGMFYPDPDNPDTSVAFSGDINNLVSAHRYKVYSPPDDLLDLIVNGTIRKSNQFAIGKLRLTECRLPLQNQSLPDVDVKVSTDDFKGYRTAMFGKTRLGKSNVVKIIAQSMIETTSADQSVGQLIFDINGEYANDNPQNLSLWSGYPEACKVYALTQRPGTPSEPLWLNFYEQPDSCLPILGSFLAADSRAAIYTTGFTSVRLPSIEEIRAEGAENTKIRMIRKVQIYWAILHRAGFRCDQQRLRDLGLRAGRSTDTFCPGFTAELMKEIDKEGQFAESDSLDSLAGLYSAAIRFQRSSPESSLLQSGRGNALFQPDDLALLDFLEPKTGAGPKQLQKYREYHHPRASDIVDNVLAHLDAGRTVILDLGNAPDAMRRYFSDLLSRAVFGHQEAKFTADKLDHRYVQLYFEEAHNLFPAKDTDLTGVYARFAKEGAKFHIGMVYSTQSPSTINKELLAQTENFFVAHLSSQDEARALARLQVAYEGLEQDILRTRTVGYMRMMTFSHRFAVPVQVPLFSNPAATQNGQDEGR